MSGSLPPTVSVVGARLVSMSRQGMTIESPFPLEPDAVLRLRLIVAGEKADVEARVSGCRPRAGGRRLSFDIGLEFTGLPAEVRERLARALGDPPESVRTA